MFKFFIILCFVSLMDCKDDTILKPKIYTAETETTSAELETTTTEPETTSIEPETTSIEPETTTTEPETSSAAPETTTVEPETTTAEPETTTAEPETTTSEPETTAAEPVTCPPYDPTDPTPTYLPDPVYCGVFYECSTGTPYRFECAGGTYFNATTDRCDWNVNCGNKITTLTPPTTPSTAAL